MTRPTSHFVLPTFISLIIGLGGGFLFGGIAMSATSGDTSTMCRTNADCSDLGSSYVCTAWDDETVGEKDCNLNAKCDKQEYPDYECTEEEKTECWGVCVLEEEGSSEETESLGEEDVCADGVRVHMECETKCRAAGFSDCGFCGRAAEHLCRSPFKSMMPPSAPYPESPSTQMHGPGPMMGPSEGRGGDIASVLSRMVEMVIRFSQQPNVDDAMKGKLQEAARELGNLLVEVTQGGDPGALVLKVRAIMEPIMMTLRPSEDHGIGMMKGEGDEHAREEMRHMVEKVGHMLERIPEAFHYLAEQGHEVAGWKEKVELLRNAFVDVKAVCEKAIETKEYRLCPEAMQSFFPRMEELRALAEKGGVPTDLLMRAGERAGLIGEEGMPPEVMEKRKECLMQPSEEERHACFKRLQGMEELPAEDDRMREMMEKKKACMEKQTDEERRNCYKAIQGEFAVPHPKEEPEMMPMDTEKMMQDCMASGMEKEKCAMYLREKFQPTGERTMPSEGESAPPKKSFIPAGGMMDGRYEEIRKMLEECITSGRSKEECVKEVQNMLREQRPEMLPSEGGTYGGQGGVNLERGGTHFYLPQPAYPNMMRPMMEPGTMPLGDSPYPPSSDSDSTSPSSSY